MPKVTKIEQQKMQSGRYSIWVDGEYVFALSANDLLSMGLHSGQEVSANELMHWRRLAGASRAYDQALNFISRRRRSEKELVDFLKRKDYSDETIAAVVERLRANAFIDDMEFAQAWVTDRNHLKPRSRRMLAQELRMKGVETEIIKEVLSETGEESELNMAVKIVQKKLTRYPDQLKLIAYLMRQGFSYNVAKRALEMIDHAD